MRTPATTAIALVAALLSTPACDDESAAVLPIDAALPADAKTADARVEQPDIRAVLGERCTPGNRVALVTVASQGGPRRDVSVSFFDKASPLYGDPFLSDASCAFHKFVPTAPCPVCETGEICAMDGVCEVQPAPAPDGELVLRSGGQEQRFTVDPAIGSVQGEITIPGKQLTMELTGLGQTITVSESAIPGDLTGITGTVSGGSENPQAVDVRWNNPGESTQVFSHIPLNHHAVGPIFTECAVPSAATTFHVDGDMLQPLAVSTGLEFQGIEHVRFAAADTDIGCVEFRLLRRHYVSLSELR